jgi:F-type H+-transporting ATPase subunit b
MRLLLLILSLTAALALGQEHAAEPKAASGTEHAQAAARHGEGHESGAIANEMLWKWVNFAILFAGLTWLARKFGAPYFQARAAAIRQGIEEARQMKADADARAAEIDRKIAHLSTEVEALRRSSREEIAAEGARVRAETEQHLAKVQAQAEAEIAAAAKTASQELKAHAAALAIKLAEDQLRSRLGPQDQNALVRSFARHLDGNGKASLS